MSRSSGFTLVELIFVIILIGILAVTTLPKLTLINKDSSLIEARDRLLSLLRHTQLQSMQNTQTTGCYKVLVNSIRFGQQTSDCTIQTLPATFNPDYLGYTQAEAISSKLRIKVNGYPVTTYYQITFNSLGIPENLCSRGCNIALTINGQTETIYIEAQGYIHL